MQIPHITVQLNIAHNKLLQWNQTQTHTKKKKKCYEKSIIDTHVSKSGEHIMIKCRIIIAFGIIYIYILSFERETTSVVN